MSVPLLTGEERRFLIGLDLGQANDYTAITAIEQEWSREIKGYLYKLRYMERVRGQSYAAIVARVYNMLKSPKLMASEPPRLIIDKTGVGAPVVDMFRVREVRPTEITITGGNSTIAAGHGFHVPKRDLVFALLTAVQNKQFLIAEGLPLAGPFMDELLNFKVKIDTKTGHDSYESWRENIHDDLVLSAAMAVWFGKYKYGRRAKFR